MSYEYPICLCGDNGLRYCEKGDEYQHLQDEYDRLYNSDATDGDVTDAEIVEDSLYETLAETVASAGSATKWSGFGLRSMCKHAMDPYTLANGHTIYISSVYDAYHANTVPDVGMYFDGMWSGHAMGFSYLIPWTDYGLPDISDFALCVGDSIAFKRNIIEVFSVCVELSGTLERNGRNQYRSIPVERQR